MMSLDTLLDKRLLQRREIGGAAPAQGRENEVEVGVDIELAALVVGIEAIVLCREAVRVHEPVAAQELPPAMIAVTGDERVVEIENGEGHGDAGLAGGCAAYRPGAAPGNFYARAKCGTIGGPLSHGYNAA
jgi:hypothetical protein